MTTPNLNPLRLYLKGLKTKEAKADFANRAGISLGHLDQIKYGNRPCAPDHAINIERESGGAVRCDDLCPDVDFDYLRRQLPYSCGYSFRGHVSLKIKIPQLS